MPKPTERNSLNVAAEKALLAAVHLPGSRFDARDPLGELSALAVSAGAEVVGEMIQNRHRPEPGTYIGSGKVDELKALCEATGATLIIFDNDLSPSQIGNIEKVCGRKVIDRSELILDIFASRATTHEAKLQVELAQLEYTYPRLRAMWDHLERIVGGGAIAGIGTRGPGEQQLEIDRRLVQRRQTMLRRELEEIQARKRREVQHRRTDHFTVGLVGYTNAGKSTLFNTLTAGGAYVENRLFSTLITRTREWDLGGGLAVMLSDTVGFVRDLPHNLVASFKATLEEVTHAHLLLVVLDVSDPAAELHFDTVNETLDGIFREVGAAEERAGSSWTPPARRVLLNKVDQLADNAETLIWSTRAPGAIPICAVDPTHPGRAELAEAVRAAALGEVRELLITVELADSRTINTLETRAEVLERVYENGAATLRARVGSRLLDQLRAAGARMSVAPASSSPARR